MNYVVLHYASARQLKSFGSVGAQLRRRSLYEKEWLVTGWGHNVKHLPEMAPTPQTLNHPKETIWMAGKVKGEENVVVGPPAGPPFFL